MSLCQHLYEIARSWPAYRLERRIDSSSSIHKLVSNSVPNELTNILQRPGELIIEGSCGRGNISAAPWITTFDPRLTKTVQDGYYPVYLFSTDLQRVYLALGCFAETGAIGEV